MSILKSSDNVWFSSALLLGLLMSIVVQATRPITTYRTLELGGSLAEVGLVAASFAVVSAPLALPIGRWSDRFGERVFVTTGFLVMGLGSAMSVAAPTIALLAVAAAAIGLGHISVAVSLQAMIANRSDHEQSDGRFGYFSVVQSLGQLIGPLAAGVLAATSAGPPNTGVVFLACAALSLLAMGASFLLWIGGGAGQHVGHHVVAQRERITPAIRRVLNVPGMPIAMVTGVIVLAAVNVLIAFLPAYGAEIGLSVQVVGVLLAVRAASSMTCRLLLGTLRRRMTRQVLLVLCMLIPAIALTLVPMTTTVPLLFILMVFTGFGLGLGQPLTLAWVAMKAPADLRGTAVAVRMAGARLGTVVVPGLAGAVAVAAGAGGVFLSLGLVLGASAALIGYGDTFADGPRGDT